MSRPDVFVHETAVIDEPVSLGPGTKVWHFCHIMRGAELGPGCNLGQNVFVAPTVKLGANVKVQNNVSLYDGVVCEDDVFLGPSCVFTNVSHPRSAFPRRGQYEATRVGRGATIGANATVVCGTTIGAHAFVGAGAVVTADVPPHALMLGVPARVSGWMCACGETLELSDSALARCRECSRQYHRAPDGSVIPATEE